MDVDSPRAAEGTPQLRYAILELTRRCNFRCVHCAIGAAPAAAKRQELTIEDWQGVIDDLVELDCAAVDVMGGEALLSPALPPVAFSLYRAGLAWGLLTNGWLLDRERAGALTDLGCRGMGVSLDGASAAIHDRIRGRKGAFERALRALDLVGLLDYKPQNRAILTSVNTLNVDQLEQLAELLSRRFPGYRWQINICSAVAPRLPFELRLDAAGVQRVVAFVDRARRTGAYDLLLPDDGSRCRLLCRPSRPGGPPVDRLPRRNPPRRRAV